MNKVKHIGILNGPNMNLLGRREPMLYGTRSFDDYLCELRQHFRDVELTYLQSNHEGVLIDTLQDWGYRLDGIVLNAAAYTHTSIALRDTIAAIDVPVVEVHITDISGREPFRRNSLLSDVCTATIMGKGLAGYKEAIETLITLTG